MYLDTHAYPAAKKLLQSRLGFQAGLAALLDACRIHYHSPFWDELAACDFDAELKRFGQWWPKPKSRISPAGDVDVLFIALGDYPRSFDLRGSTKWSRDPDDWQWWYHDDYSGPQFSSEIMGYALDRAEAHDKAAPPQPRRVKDASQRSQEVVEMFFSLGYFGLLVRELIRRTDSARILGQRASRWFVIGHPDAVYGIILGKLTRSRWQTFHG